MIFSLLAFQEEVIEAVSVLRSDPLLYLVVVLPILALSGMLLLYKTKHDENKELRAENKQLVDSIVEGNRLSTQAITSQVEVMRVMREDQKDALGRYEDKTDKIFNVLNDIKVKVTK